MRPGLRSSLFPLANMDLCAQDSVFSVSSSFSCPLYPPDLSSALQGTPSSNVHARKTNCIVHEWLQFAFGCDPPARPPAKIKNFNKQHLFLISLPRRSALSFSFFSFLRSHPNAVVGIPYDAAYTQHNTEMSFSFTPLPQTLPYKYRRQDKRIRNSCSA